jgi:CheY-like chemotaxis protein
MTAQSMGKKILSEAGYEVVAVSNGAAAVKKIAEQKPDIIILDVYMPGYSGLEVCEKVRGSMDTLKTPVLLTVGKMEPYRAEDGNRVRADGVIVKPFEASDLLAIVKKLEERINRAPARVEQPVLVEHARQDGVEATRVELPVEAAEPAAFAVTATQSTVEVPDHMAGNSAFGDLLTAEPLSTIPEMTVPPPPVSHAVPEPPPPMPRSTAVPEYEVPVSWRDEDEVRVEAVPAPAAAVPEPKLEAVPVEPEIAEPEPAASPLSPIAARARRRRSARFGLALSCDMTITSARVPALANVRYSGMARMFSRERLP